MYYIALSSLQSETQLGPTITFFLCVKLYTSTKNLQNKADLYTLRPLKLIQLSKYYLPPLYIKLDSLIKWGTGYVCSSEHVSPLVGFFCCCVDSELLLISSMMCECSSACVSYDWDLTRSWVHACFNHKSRRVTEWVSARANTHGRCPNKQHYRVCDSKLCSERRRRFNR